MTKDTAKIDWTWDIKKIERFIRALNPWPIAWTFTSNVNGDLFKMKIFSAEIDEAKHQLIPKIVQIEGKNKIDWSEIKKYYSIIDKKL